VAAASSFRRERETGVLELLLVAPLREWQIIAGRVRGIWVQFLPAVCLLLGVWLFAATFLSSADEVPFVLGHAVTFATVPVVGLYFSLTKANFISALILTLLLQIVLPEVAYVIYGSAVESISSWSSFLFPAAAQLLVAGLLAWRLWLRLKTRAFAYGALVG
jgi:ABC-type Na+ efflux pump permease subunit